MRVWALFAKDLRIYLRDRVGLVLSLGLPVVLALIFGAAMGAMGGGGGGMGRATLLVQDEDGSEASRELLRELQAASGLRIRVRASTSEGGTPLRDDIADGDGPAGLWIPAGYGADPADHGLRLFRDPGRAIEQQVIAGNLMPVLMSTSGELLGERMTDNMLDWVEFPEPGRDRAQSVLDESRARMDALMDTLEAEGVFEDVASETPSAGETDEGGPASFDFSDTLVDVLGLEVEDVAGPDRDDLQRIGQQTQAIAGIAVMMLLFGLVACGGTLLEEEAQGTLDRLRLTPGTANTVLNAKLLFAFVLGLVQLGLLFVVTRQIFDIPIFRDPLALFVHSAAVAFAATGFGVLFAVLCRSRTQLEGLSTITILTMSAFGGSWWPLSMTPDWYQKLAHLTLTAWAMDGYQALFWFGKGLPDIWLELVVLTAIGLVTSLAARALWSRRLRVA